MTSHQVESILIRQRDNNDEPNNQQPTKIQRLENTDETIQATKIIDLNDDCLLKIFRHLNLKSLFNVAVANEWLRPAAGEVYKRKFGAKKVRIPKCDDYYSNTHAVANNGKFSKVPGLNEMDTTIVVRGLKPTLQFLRCFGSSINNLTINYNKSKSKRYQYVLQYINDYCAKSLIEISIFCMPNVAIATEQPFQNVFHSLKNVQFQCCSLGQQWPSILEYFSNVQNLHLVRNVYCETNKVILKPFQHLKNISIVASKDTWLNKNMANFFQMAPQLSGLEITAIDNFEVPMGPLLDLIKHNQSISKLILNPKSYRATIMNSEHVQQLITNHPALIVLYLPNYRFSGGDANTVIHKLNTLKKFRFRMKSSDQPYFENQLVVAAKAKKAMIKAKNPMSKAKRLKSKYIFYEDSDDDYTVDLSN